MRRLIVPAFLAVAVLFVVLSAVRDGGAPRAQDLAATAAGQALLGGVESVSGTQGGAVAVLPDGSALIAWATVMMWSWVSLRRWRSELSGALGSHGAFRTSPP